MRKPKYLSPTALALFRQSPEDYYLKYLVENRPEREPQTPAMSVGSAFDAFVKAELHSRIYGPNADPRFSFENLFRAQVEPHNHKVAREAGEWCFEWYVKLGALDALTRDLNKAIGKPRFEIDLRGTIHGEDAAGDTVGVPLNGKPDCFYVSDQGISVILDWKVNGYYSNSPPSPMPGYLLLRADAAPAMGHKDARAEEFKGVTINAAATLDQLNEEWGTQLTTYSCQTGNEVGQDFVGRIEQIVCNAKRLTAGRPSIRIASHSLLVPAEFQKRVFKGYAELWALLSQPPETFHFFRSMSIDDSRARCAQLEGRAALMSRPKTDKDAWFQEQFKKAR